MGPFLSKEVEFGCKTFLKHFSCPFPAPVPLGPGNPLDPAEPQEPLSPLNWMFSIGDLALGIPTGPGLPLSPAEMEIMRSP